MLSLHLHNTKMLLPGYGLTETSGATIMGGLKSAKKSGTVGKVIAGQEIKVKWYSGNLIVFKGEMHLHVLKYDVNCLSV